MDSQKSGEALTVSGLQLDISLLEYRVRPCLPTCAAPCCRGAAAAGRDKIEKIQATLPEIMPLLRPASARVIARKGFYCAQATHRSDFQPEEEPHWLRIVDGYCVFYNDALIGGHCALHAYCVQRGLPVLSLKPQVCYLFPISKPVNHWVTVRRWNELPCLRPTNGEEALPVYLAYRSELESLLGEKGYEDALRGWASRS